MISRRGFVKKTGFGLLSAAMVPYMNSLDKKSFKMGLQLFSIRDAMKQDPIESLKTMAGVGYEDLETYGFNPERGEYYGFKAADFYEILVENGLTTSSGHYDLFVYLNRSKSDLNRYVDQCIQGAKALRQDYITWPWLPPEARSLETFKRLPGLLNHIGERITKAGLGFAYHNHDFEFVDYSGQNGFEIILRETDPTLVKIQLDMYWAARASKEGSVKLIKKAPERFVMWHIKDMHKTSKDYTELGNGSINYDDVLSNASQDGLEFYFLEQGGNFVNDSMQSMTDNALYFKKHLKKYL